MKFLPLNVDFSSPSPDLLRSRRRAHPGVKEGYPTKSGYFSAIDLSGIKKVADRHKHKHAAYHNKQW